MALEDHDEESGYAEGGPRKRLTDFDCPTCDANNPYDDGIYDGDEIRCYYCGEEFKVRIGEDGRLRLRTI